MAAASAVETVCGDYRLEETHDAADGVFKAISGVALGADGSVYFSAQEIHRVLVRRPDGKLQTVAGTGTAGFSGDGRLATNARIKLPFGVAIGPYDELYFVDTGNRRVRKIDSKGQIITVIGDGAAPVKLKDIPIEGRLATEQALNFPFELYWDGSRFWLSDAADGRVYQFNPASGVLKVAMAYERGGACDPTGMALVNGKLLVADRRLCRVLSLEIETGKVEVWLDGSKDRHRLDLSLPTGLAYDGKDYVYLSDQGHNKIFRIKVSDKSVEAYAGDGKARHFGDGGKAPKASFHRPATLVMSNDGKLLVAERFNYRVRSIEPNGTVQTVAGRGVGDGASAKEAWLRLPRGIAVDAQGHVYVSDCQHWRIRRIEKGVGKIETVAGSGYYTGGVIGGDPLEASVYAPRGMAFDKAGVLYIADGNYNGVWRADFKARRMDFAVQEPWLVSPAGVAFAPDGTLYIADRGAHTIWRLNAQGKLELVAGREGEPGNEGDGGPALKAKLNGPESVAIGRSGEVYILERGGNRVRVVRNGIISAYIGTGEYGNSGNGGPATQATLNSPGMVMDAKGDLVLCDINMVVRKVEKATGKIRWVKGVERDWQSEEKPLSVIDGLALFNGNLYVADSGKHAVHLIKGI